MAAKPRHLYDDGCCLLETSPRAPEPRGFVSKLWDPQKTLLAAMVSYEDLHAVRLKDRPAGVDLEPADADPLMRTSVARIAERLSFGKTVVCIALICAAPVPRAYPIAVGMLQGRPGTTDGWERLLERGLRPRKPALRVGVKHARVLAATLVVVNSSVLTQWRDSLALHAPELRVVAVANVRDFRAFAARLAAGEAAGRHDFDVVLLKAGSVTTGFAAPGETINPVDLRISLTHRRAAQSGRPTTQAMRALTARYAWARFIVDDYDMIRLDWRDVFVPALFTWLISATNRRTSVAQFCVAERPGRGAGGFLWANMVPPLLLPTVDTFFRTSAVCLRCDPRYVDRHIQSLEPAYRLITLGTGHAAKILGALAVRGDIIEMAEAGAIETASRELNISAGSVSEVVARVLRKHVDRYRRAVAVLAAVEAARARAEDPARAGEPPLADVAGRARRAEELPAEGSVDMTDALNGALAALTSAMRHVRTEVGLRLERLRGNLREGYCQVCNVEWEEGGEDELYIVNCCQIVLCAHCVVEPGGFIRSCPHCTAPVRPRQNLICVGAGLDIGPVLDDAALAAAELAATAELAAAEPAAAGAEEGSASDRYARWEGDRRLQAFLQLVEGAAVDRAAKDEPNIPPFVSGLVGGRAAVPLAAGAARRVLVFAMFPESCRQIAAGLETLGVSYAQLGGGQAERDRATAAFRDGGVRVLVVVSNRDSAGLHLPEATHVVLYHRHRSRDIVLQCVGRAQRVGRTCSLEVVQLG